MIVHTREEETALLPLPLRKDDPICGTNFYMQVAFVYKLSPVQNDPIIMAMQCLEMKSAGKPLSRVLSNEEACTFALRLSGKV